ncbi:unnamed protein product, partial [Tilletia controversa]
MRFRNLLGRGTAAPSHGEHAQRRPRRWLSGATATALATAAVIGTLAVCLSAAQGVAATASPSLSPRQHVTQAGQPTHKRHEFPATVTDYTWFHNSTNVLAHCLDGSIWLSSNEGLTWNALKDVGGDHGDGHALGVIPHRYSHDRAYLIGRGRRVWYTTDRGSNWGVFDAPDVPNSMGLNLLEFNPRNPDWLIWSGQYDCEHISSPNCRARAWYSTDGGNYWEKLDEYVKTCAWPHIEHFKENPQTIICESYKSKSGSQRSFTQANNPLELIVGDKFYKSKKKIFDNVVDFATFSEFILVGELLDKGTTLRMQVSLNGRDFTPPVFPPSMSPKSQADTVLESRTHALFLHHTTHPDKNLEWGALMKSNSNGSYYIVSQDFVNRNKQGFVDFDKTQSMEGIAFVNIVSNPESAAITRVKQLQTRVTHNDGGHWDLLDPPAHDLAGKPYGCVEKNCSLHLQSFTERPNPALSYTSPTAPGLILAVGNVGTKLDSWAHSDTFL